MGVVPGPAIILSQIKSVVNTIYYGIAFILYAANVWMPTLTGIALLFGIGNAFDSIVSFVAYAFLLRKEKINILKVE